jgi:hypothetical protein
MVMLRLSEERPDAAVKAAVNEVVRQARSEWSPLAWEGEFPRGGFGITSISPEHVYGGTTSPNSSVTWGASITTACTWNDWFNTTITDQAYVIPCGVFDLDSSPQVTEMQVSANGVDLPVMNIEEIFGFDIARSWFTRPFAVKPNNNLTIALAGRAATTDERFGLVGYTVAKRAYIISRT